MHFRISLAKWKHFGLSLDVLTHKHLEFVFINMATDAQVLKHQANSIHSTD